MISSGISVIFILMYLVRLRGVEVKVGDVHGHGGNHTVKQNLGGKHVGGGCGDFTGIVDPVTAHN